MEQQEPSNDYDRSENRPHAVSVTGAASTDAPSKAAVAKAKSPSSPPVPKQVMEEFLPEDFDLEDGDDLYLIEEIHLHIQPLSSSSDRRSALHNMISRTADATQSRMVDGLQSQSHRRRTYTTVALMSAPKMLLADIPSTASVAMSVIKMLAHSNQHPEAINDNEAGEGPVSGLHSDGLKVQHLNGSNKRGLTARLGSALQRFASHPRTQSVVHTIHDALHDPVVLAGLTGLYGYLAIKTGTEIDLGKLPQTPYMIDMAKTAVYSLVASTSGVSLVREVRDRLDKRHEEKAKREAEQRRQELRQKRLDTVRLRRKTPRAESWWEKDEQGRLSIRYRFNQPEDTKAEPKQDRAPASRPTRKP